MKRRRVHSHIRKTSAVAMLPMILALSFIILIIVLSIGTLGFVETNIGAAQKKADNAFFVANAGISDATIKISRDKNYSSAGYTLTVGDGSASIVVEKDQPAAGQDRITSTGTVSVSKRKIQVIVNVSTYGKVTTSSWTELAP